MSINILTQPNSSFYKDEGKYSINNLIVKFELINIQNNINIFFELYYDDNSIVNNKILSIYKIYINSVQTTIKKNYINNLDFNSKNIEIHFKILKCSSRVDNKLYKLCISTSNNTINNIFTDEIKVLSKRNKKKRLISDSDKIDFVNKFTNKINNETLYNETIKLNKKFNTLNDNLSNFTNLLNNNLNNLNNNLNNLNNKFDNLNNKFDNLNNKFDNLNNNLNNNIYLI
jgi:methyl-accepting chemotaxis protein